AANVSGNTIDVGSGMFNTGQKVIDAIVGQKVVYHQGSGSSGNLVDGATYYVIGVDMTHIQLSATKFFPSPLALGTITGTGHVLSIGDFVVAGRVRLVPPDPSAAVIRTNKDAASLYIESGGTRRT